MQRLDIEHQRALRRVLHGLGDEIALQAADQIDRLRECDTIIPNLGVTDIHAVLGVFDLADGRDYVLSDIIDMMSQSPKMRALKRTHHAALRVGYRHGYHFTDTYNVRYPQIQIVREQ